MPKPRSIQIIAALTLLIAANAFATDKQDFNISAPLKPVPGQAVSGVLTDAQLKPLVETVITNATDRANRAFMIHAVHYQSGKLTPSTQNWYVTDYTPVSSVETVGDLHLSTRYKDPRIFGRKSLGIVYLHILEAIPASTVQTFLRTPPYSDTLKASFDPTGSSDLNGDIASDIADIQKYDPANPLIARAKASAKATPPLAGDALVNLWREVSAEWSIVLLVNTGVAGPTSLVSSKGNSLKPWGSYFVETGMDSISSLSYGIDVQSKTPAPLQNLQQILSLAFTSQGSNLGKIPFTLVDTPFAGGAVFDTTLTPSDVAVTATYTSSGKDTQIGTQTYDDEGRYWYDFSLALPVTSFNDLSYDSTGNTVSARTIKKNNVYAMLNLGLPRDTKNTTLLIVPTFLYGIPIASQPLQHHIFAGSVGLKYVSVFVGARLDEKTFYHDFSEPLTGNNAFRVWRTHLTWGINFPVAYVVKALSKSK
jgi:hypothetical protein